MKESPIIIALDVESAVQARTLVRALGDDASFYKIGMELYAAAGMDFVRELIASGLDDYVELNVRLAHDRSWREELRANLRNRLASSPLMDDDAFVADLESTYRQVWFAWCASRARSAGQP